MPRRTRIALAAGAALVAVAALLAGRILARVEDERRLPTGARLDPAGHSIALGSMPLSMVFDRDSTHAAVLLCGYREQGVQIVDLRTEKVTQTLLQPAAFVGLALSPDGRTLFASGGNQDVVYRYAWTGGVATLEDSLRLVVPDSLLGQGLRYPAGLACSPDGRFLYVAENLADSLAVIDLARGRVVQRFATGTYPYGVAVDADGRVFVSAWGGDAVATFAPGADGLVAGPRIAVGRHPSALALAGDRLYVARASFDRVGVVDTRGNRLLGELSDTPAGAPPEGGTPDGLTLSPDGRRLLVAEADHNAAALFDVARATSGSAARGPDHLIPVARVPVEWYPTAVLAHAGKLYVLNGKGKGTAANPQFGQPGLRHHPDPHGYSLGQTTGSLSVVDLPADGNLAAMTARVARADGWNAAHARPSYPPFRHVIYVIRENRTYDQVLGDVAAGDGDTSLVYFGRDVTPNAHALAERFGLFDRFFVNAEVSGQGHNWTTAGYCSDYVEKTIPSIYSGRGRSYDYEGQNRDTTTDDDVAEPGNGYLWDAARRAGVAMRNYGEFTHADRPGHWVVDKATLAPSTCPTFPGFDLDTSDQARVDAWLVEFHRAEETGEMAPLTLLRLPNDHTAGATVDAPTPRAFVADNDLALGRMIEALSRSRFWKDTVVFVVEDDAQDGPDHVDSHRSPLLVISAWNRPGVVHRFANTTGVVATIGQILHLTPLSQFEEFAWPLGDVFAKTPDTSAYTVLTPVQSLAEKNSPKTPGAKAMGALDLRREDPPNEDLFNRILWAMLKGPDRPYPASLAINRSSRP